MMEKLLPGKELGKKISPKKGLVENIWPMEEMGGRHELVLFSNGPILACGAVICLRWKLKEG